jgi:hypothetical protein
MQFLACCNAPTLTGTPTSFCGQNGVLSEFVCFSCRALDKFAEFGDKWQPEFLPDSLKYYPIRVEKLLRLVKQSVEVFILVTTLPLVLYSIAQMDPSNKHTISTDVYEHLKRDICMVVARLVLCFRNPDWYKTFLAKRGSETQPLLDFLQDVSTSNLIRMLVPTEQQTVA